ncbi:MAG TPA: YceI family protein [Thermoanaerobaculia bacterium]|nr:YceI family protein [Thermoanaerobaculia bacterium]
MRSILTTVAAALLAVSAFAADTYVVDRNHSEATFQVRHFVSRVSGKFDDFAGAISVDAANPAASSVEFTIKTTSIDTGVADRDKDLRGPNFFEVEKFPEISFKSTSIKPGSRKDVYDVTGTFTLHGVTKSITLPVEFLGFIKDNRGNQHAGFTTRTTINRKDYGIVWNRALDAGGTLLSDDVDITVNIEAIKPAAAVKEEVKKEKTE